MNKHIVKHIVLGVNALFLGALYPCKSGLMNKHIVKHIVPVVTPLKIPVPVWFVTGITEFSAVDNTLDYRYR